MSSRAIWGVENQIILRFRGYCRKSDKDVLNNQIDSNLFKLVSPAKESKQLINELVHSGVATHKVQFVTYELISFQ